MPDEGLFGQIKRFVVGGLVILRLGAVVLAIVSVYVLSSLMLRLPWQVDCVIAAAAALAFAYRFEREESR